MDCSASEPADGGAPVIKTPAVPPLRIAVLSHIAADWTEFQQLRAAASAFSARSRLQNATSIVVNEVRVAFAAALLSERTSCASDSHYAIQIGPQLRHAAAPKP